eukprot:5838467-Prymnesium_polylepis.1
MNGPGAIALTVMRRGPSSPASILVRWCTPALLAAYAYVPMPGGCEPARARSTRQLAASIARGLRRRAPARRQSTRC